jgi:hypothetical protein
VVVVPAAAVVGGGSGRAYREGGNWLMRNQNVTHESPLDEGCVPLGQSLHWQAPDWEIEPAGHAWHPLPSLENSPAGQGLHDVWSLLAPEPQPHTSHEWAPGEVDTSPAGHSWQMPLPLE